MQTTLEVAGLVAGFVLLIKGAGVFVDSSVNIAKRLKIPNIVIGLTIVAFGTSAPEAVISVSAALSGANDMAIGNVIGSNIFNLLLTVGLCAVFAPISVRVREISRDFWVSVGAVTLLLLMKLIFNDVIPRTASFVLFAAYAAYVVILVLKALKNRTQKEEKDTITQPLTRSIFFSVLGIGAIVGGGQLAVNNAVSIAATLGITERVVGLAILAVGTSLPELTTALVACKKGKNDLALGNIIGSNIFNIMFALGLSGMLMPLAIDNSLMFDLAVLGLSSLAFLLFATTGKRIVRIEGLSMLMMYALYMVIIIQPMS